MLGIIFISLRIYIDKGEKNFFLRLFIMCMNVRIIFVFFYVRYRKDILYIVWWVMFDLNKMLFRLKFSNVYFFACV